MTDQENSEGSLSEVSYLSNKVKTLEAKLDTVQEIIRSQQICFNSLKNITYDLITRNTEAIKEQKTVIVEQSKIVDKQSECIISLKRKVETRLVDHESLEGVYSYLIKDISKVVELNLEAYENINKSLKVPSACIEELERTLKRFKPE